LDVTLFAGTAPSRGQPAWNEFVTRVAARRRNGRARQRVHRRGSRARRERLPLVRSSDYAIRLSAARGRRSPQSSLDL